MHEGYSLVQLVVSYKYPRCQYLVLDSSHCDEIIWNVLHGLSKTLLPSTSGLAGQMLARAALSGSSANAGSNERKCCNELLQSVGCCSPSNSFIG